MRYQRRARDGELQVRERLRTLAAATALGLSTTPCPAQA